MVHLIYKLYLKAVFLWVKLIGAIGFFWKMFVFNVKHVLNSKKKAWDPKSGAWRSQNWCLMIPKLVPDGPKNGAWQLSGTISGIFSEIPNIIPDNWLYRRVQLICTLLYSQLSGIIFGISENIPEMVPDNRQAPVLGPSRTSFGIVRHQFSVHQAPVLGSSGTSFGISRLFFGV